MFCSWPLLRYWTKNEMKALNPHIKRTKLVSRESRLKIGKSFMDFLFTLLRGLKILITFILLWNMVFTKTNILVSHLLFAW